MSTMPPVPPSRHGGGALHCAYTCTAGRGVLGGSDRSRGAIYGGAGSDGGLWCLSDIRLDDVDNDVSKGHAIRLGSLDVLACFALCDTIRRIGS